MHSIIKPFRYVFYRILTWKLRDPRAASPAMVAGGATALLLFFNGVLVLMLTRGLRGNVCFQTCPRQWREFTGGFALSPFVARARLPRRELRPGSLRQIPQIRLHHIELALACCQDSFSLLQL
jgi:hypothetical protein